MKSEKGFRSRRATFFGLAVALLGIPAILLAFRLVFGTISSTPQLIAKEVSILASAALLLWIVVKEEKLPLSSIGIGTRPLGNSILWGLIGLVLCAVGLAAALGLVKLFGWRFGGSDVAGYQPPLWATSLAVLRAGTVEEIFYRGYGIERLESLTGKTSWSVAITLALSRSSTTGRGMPAS
jgi:hypothetical protein